MLFSLARLLRSVGIWILHRRLRTLVVLLLALYPLRWLQGLLFGFGSTRIGGLFGRLIDNAIRKSLFESREAWHEQRFARIMGYTLPSMKDANSVGVQVLLNSWLSESLVRRTARRTALEQHRAASLQESTTVQFPIIQVNMGDWYRPIDWGAEFTVLEFDEEDVTEFMLDHFAPLYRSVYQRSDLAGRVHLFALAVIYQYGGIFVEPNITNADAMFQQADGIQEWMERTKKKDQPSLFLQSVNDRSISVLAASPLHSTLKCAVNQLMTLPNHADWTNMFKKVQHNHWDPTCEPHCCPLARLPPSETTDVLRLITTKSGHQERETPVSSSSTTVTKSRYSVSISQQPVDPPRAAAVPKERCSQRLAQQGCAPGWLCNRCLRTALAGNLHTCRWICRSCYTRTVCVAPPPMRTVPVQVKVTELDTSQPRIPRIIHQTALEPLTTAKYPHFQRLQHSWKASGWEYRFYTDKDCIEFIQSHYPPLFVDAFRAIQPGAFKADLFRLLVLFQQGGIYADVDVQLDTHLDTFITHDLSFFVPRDVPVDYWPHANYCLWNGLMGAAPGHPLLAQAITDVVNTIRNRGDYYDVEGRMCSRDLERTEIWKLRTLPILILTGPCALGMSINTFLNNSNVLDGFDIGWLGAANGTSRTDDGHSLILLADRYDTGELRFIDIDRNMVVASTNQDRLARDPIPDGRGPTQQKNIHYSKTESDIVGEFGTYKDDLSASELVALQFEIDVE